MIRTAVVIVGAAVLVIVAVLALREGTETRHVAAPPDSHVDVTATASVRGDKDRTADLTQALASLCVVESVPNSTMRDFDQSDDEFTFQVVPAADEPDRRQLRGCLQDFKIPGLLAEVDAMEVVGVDD